MNLPNIYYACIHFDTWGINNISLQLFMLYVSFCDYYCIKLYIYSEVNSAYCHNGSLYIQKMFNTSHILVLEFKCAHSCSHTFFFKSSYYNDHEENIINNLNFIKKPDSCKSINWFPDEFHTNHIVQCNTDQNIRTYRCTYRSNTSKQLNTCTFMLNFVKTTL